MLSPIKFDIQFISKLSKVLKSSSKEDCIQKQTNLYEIGTQRQLTDYVELLSTTDIHFCYNEGTNWKISLVAGKFLKQCLISFSYLSVVKKIQNVECVVVDSRSVNYARGKSPCFQGNLKYILVFQALY